MPYFNPLNAELNPIRHLLALVGVRHIVHVSRIRVKYDTKKTYGEVEMYWLSFTSRPLCLGIKEVTMSIEHGVGEPQKWYGRMDD